MSHQTLRQNTHNHTLFQGFGSVVRTLSLSTDSLLTSVHVTHNSWQPPASLSITLDGKSLVSNLFFWRSMAVFRFMVGLSAGEHVLIYKFTGSTLYSVYHVISISENIVSPGLKSDFALFDRLFKKRRDPAKLPATGRIPLIDIVRPPDTPTTIIPWWAPRGREVLSFSWGISGSKVQGASEQYSSVVPRPFMILSYQVFCEYDFLSGSIDSHFATHSFTTGFLGANESLPLSPSALLHPVFYTDGAPSDLVLRGWWMFHRVWSVAPLADMRVGVRLNYKRPDQALTYTVNLVLVLQYI